MRWIDKRDGKARAQVLGLSSQTGFSRKIQSSPAIHSKLHFWLDRRGNTSRWKYRDVLPKADSADTAAAGAEGAAAGSSVHSGTAGGKRGRSVTDDAARAAVLVAAPLPVRDQQAILGQWGVDQHTIAVLCKQGSTIDQLMSRWSNMSQVPVPPAKSRKTGTAARAPNNCEGLLLDRRGVVAREVDAGQYDAGHGNGCLYLAGFLGYAVLRGMPRDGIAASYLQDDFIGPLMSPNAALFRQWGAEAKEAVAALLPQLRAKSVYEFRAAARGARNDCLG
eukprot:gene15123-10666_t